MRPRKRICCIGRDENALAVRRFVLQVHGYSVLCVPTAKAAVAAVMLGGVDLVIGEAPCVTRAWGRLATAVHAADPHCNLLLLVDARASDGEFAVETAMRRATLDVRERVRLLAGRKRGPRKVRVAAVLPVEAQNGRMVDRMVALAAGKARRVCA